MFDRFDVEALPPGGLLMLCTSHEDRCLGVIESIRRAAWRPRHVVVVNYTEVNERREANRRLLLAELEKLALEYTEDFIDDSKGLDGAAIASKSVRALVSRFGQHQLLVDVSVLTRRHMLILMRWLWFSNIFSKTTFLYTEPENYIVHPWLPMSFGVRSVEAVAGFPSVANPSRPLHFLISPQAQIRFPAYSMGYSCLSFFNRKVSLQPAEILVFPIAVSWVWAVAELGG